MTCKPPRPIVEQNAEGMEWRCRDRMAFPGQTAVLVMGILNVTPDSFSDGGRFDDVERAVAHGLRMAEDGADIIDIGGESSRPGARPIPVRDEIERVRPVVEELARQTKAMLSVDTVKAAVAEAALKAGAHMVNDISALQDDPAMAATARRCGAGVILMHKRGSPATMQDHPHYADVAAEVLAWLETRLAAALAAGLPAAALAIDPGIGFGKTAAHNLRLLSRLAVFTGPRRPLVVGLSRKSFLGAITGRDVDQRLPATLAGLTWCVLAGAQVLRVHDVAAARDAVRVVQALQQERVPA